MRCTKIIFLCVGILLDLGFCTVILPSITDRKFIDQCVKEHNDARSSVNPPAINMLYMTWDEALAKTASAWVKKCQYGPNIYLEQADRGHPTFFPIGENLWIGTETSNFDLSTPIRTWVTENQYYAYTPDKCSGVCGHYKQVVCADSYKVGCAVNFCPKGFPKLGNVEAFIFVCNYFAKGNLPNTRPYLTGGLTCSGCGDSCENKLCRSDKRDTELTYKWSPDLNTSLDRVASGYETIVTVRPIALILTVFASYIVCYFYPNIFFYE